MARSDRSWLPEHAVLAGEIGAIRRTAPRIFALGYPAPYAVAASSLGFQTVYRELNADPGLACERFFGAAGALPRRPLRTAESGFPVRGAAAIGFSIACETELAGVASLLEAAGLEPIAAQREPDVPAVIAGGPLTLLDPRLLAAIADAVVVGDAEEGLPALREAVATARDKGELLARLACGIPGVWVPSRGGAAGEPAVASIERLPAFAACWSPRAELKDLFLVEAARGCSRGCAFCVLSRKGGGRAFRPVPAERILAAIPAGAPGVGLVGAAVTDHPEIEEIVARVVEAGRRVSLSSVRADRLTPGLATQLARGGLRTLTLAADGASERIRAAVRKGLTAGDLERAAALAAAAGLRQLKVYAMVGLPDETDADVEELAGLLRGLAARLEVTAAVQAFVPKPGTRLAAAEMAPLADLRRRLDLLKRLAGGRYRVRPTSPRWSWVDWRLAHAGIRAGEIAVEASRNGGGFAAWKAAIEAHDAA